MTALGMWPGLRIFTEWNLHDGRPFYSLMGSIRANRSVRDRSETDLGERSGSTTNPGQVIETKAPLPSLENRDVNGISLSS